MLLDKSGKLLTTLDFRGSKTEQLEKITAKEMLQIVATIQQLINRTETFVVRDLSPDDWAGTVYEPIYDACDDKSDMTRLFGVIVKQILILSPLLFVQDGDGWESRYSRA
ncbi:MAG: hypothetical protein FWC80_04285 [Firmicutes bacterium]|nr:hypothetical protein [Bacillota bacterium]